MNTTLKDTPLSILDLATIVEGDATPAESFHRSLEVAQLADELGYKRYWFAEHHNTESVASSATSVLVGYIASGTKNIRVGSGGVMLPNHSPLVIAEQFGTLAALYPERIDLGVGRAPGTDQVTSFALRRSMQGDINQFPHDVIELINYFEPKDVAAKVQAIPGVGSKVPVWLLGSSTYSAQLAAMLGLPFAFASHFAPTNLHKALQIYREKFQPSKFLDEPYSMACVNVIVADNDAEAKFLATSFFQLALGLFRNDRRPLPPPVASMKEIWTEAEQAGVQQMLKYSFTGSPETIKTSLERFLKQTGVDELMVASHLYDLHARKHSLKLLKEFAGRE